MTYMLKRGEKMVNRILGYFLILGFLFSLNALEEKLISVKIEAGKKGSDSNPLLKINIKNITDKVIDSKNIELSTLGLVNEDGSIGSGYSHITLSYKNKNIKPGESIAAILELKPNFKFLEGWDKIKDSKKPFDVHCSIRYHGEIYFCNKLKMKIN